MTLRQEIINILDSHEIRYNANSSEEELIQLLKNNEKVDWFFISAHQTLSEDLIRKFKNKVCWDWISRYQDLSENFIREFQDKCNWDYISYYQTLSEDFIREFQNKVDWYEISRQQILSEKFIKEFKDKVFWVLINKYQKLSDRFRKKFNLEKPQNNWLYVSKKYKKEFIKKHTDYEIKNSCIIAYKSVRKNLSSVFKPGLQYKIGKTYTSSCNCNLNEQNSFGLSAWDKKNALDYYRKGKLLKVSIPIKKLGACILYDNNKLRAFEMTILEEVEF